MPIQIGQAEPGWDDPIGLMTACHRRIERFLGTLCAAARQAAERILEPDEIEAVERSLRYFRDAAPHHTADEEQDLFPALTRKQPEAAVAIGNLKSDHARAVLLHTRADQIGREWIEAGRLSGPALQEFGEATSQLESLYRGHIRLEEAEVFPLAASVLDVAELDSIGRRMAQRRG
mgnify:CR=1 FL=1